MFKVGDKIFCPMRGCGIIEKLEEKTLLDEPQEYFIIKMFRSNMTIMIPTKKISSANYRLLSDCDTANKALAILNTVPVTSPQSVPIKQRIKDNTAKINSGSLQDYAEVMNDLAILHRIKTLNSSEQALFSSCKKFFAEEFSLINDLCEADVLNMLDSLLNA